MEDGQVLAALAEQLLDEGHVDAGGAAGVVASALGAPLAGFLGRGALHRSTVLATVSHHHRRLVQGGGGGGQGCGRRSGDGGAGVGRWSGETRRVGPSPLVVRHALDAGEAGGGGKPGGRRRRGLALVEARGSQTPASPWLLPVAWRRKESR